MKPAVRLKLGPNDAGCKVSAAEFAAADYETPFRYERVHGRLVVLSPCDAAYQKLSRPFRRELGGYWGDHRHDVDDVDVEGWIATSNEDDRVPNICVYLAGDNSDQHVPHRVPDLTFEFVSASRADQERDYIDKREEYHRIGVREYVIVDRFKQSVLVLTWQKDDYAEQTLAASETYTTPLLPGLSVELGEVFA